MRVKVSENKVEKNWSTNYSSVYETFDDEETEPHAAFFYVEVACNSWFTFELAMRSIVSIHHVSFLLKCYILLNETYAILWNDKFCKTKQKKQFIVTVLHRVV